MRLVNAKPLGIHPNLWYVNEIRRREPFLNRSRGMTVSRQTDGLAPFEQYVSAHPV